MQQKWNLTANGTPANYQTCWVTDGVHLAAARPIIGRWFYSNSEEPLQFSPTHYLIITEPDLPNESNTNQ